MKERERVSGAFGDKVADFAEKVTRDDGINTATRAKTAADRVQLDAREPDCDRRDQEAADARLCTRREDTERVLAAAGPAP